MLKKFMLSKRAGDTHYLCSETATYWQQTRDQRKQYERREEIDENRIAYLLGQSIDRVMTWEKK